jgi:RHS repeat-associated protein
LLLRLAYEQVHIPFGTALNAESSLTTNNKRFTSYDRSAATGLDYAINRTYDSKQGRFTQVDPIGMSAVHAFNPQTLNLFTYCGNDPVNHTDPDGLFWSSIKKLFKGIGKALKWIAVGAAIAMAIVTIVMIPASAALWFKVLTWIGAIAGAASSVSNAFGLKTLGKIFDLVGAAASFGLTFYNQGGKLFRKAYEWSTKAILNAVKAGATLVSKTLSAFGHNTSSRILGLGADILGFIGSGVSYP